MTIVEIVLARDYFFATIGELLEVAQIVTNYEEGVKLADTGLVEIISDNFPNAVVKTHREMVCFHKWCDIIVGGKLTKVVVKEK